MIINNLKVAYRSLLLNKIYSIINIIGLTTALSVVLLISLYIKDDLSFDRFHKKGNQIYRLVTDYKNRDNSIRKSGNTGFIQGPVFKEEVAEISNFCRFRNGWNTLVKRGQDAFKEQLLYTDSSVFSMFTFDFLAGDPKNALDKLNSIVITDKMAEKYFDTMNAVGKILYVGDLADEMVPFEVTGIVKSLPTNSSIQFDLLCNIGYHIKKDKINFKEQSWYNSSLNTFLLVKENTNIAKLLQTMDKVTQNYVQAQYQSDLKSDQNALPPYIEYKLQPFFDMHLDPEYFATNGLRHWSDVLYPKILSGISLLLILIAAINFINLSLSRSVQRAKEIGIRKATGSTRSQIFFQLLNESALTTAVAAIPAYCIACMLLPSFSELTGKYLHPTLIFAPQNVFIFILLVFIIALCVGVYPAFVMSGFNPIDSLKGRVLFGTKHRLRQSLVILQFTLACVLITGTAFVTQQFRYIHSKPLGYETNDRYRFWLPWEEISTLGHKLKTALKSVDGIALVSSKSGDYNKTTYTIDGRQTDWIYYEHIDENHLQLMGIPLVTGRYFSMSYGLDTVSNLIVNEAFVHKYLPKGVDPLQFPLKDDESSLHIVGVVKDFHYSDFKEKIEPMVFMLDRGSQAGMIHIKIKSGSDTATLAAVQSIYKEFVPFLPIQIESLEECRINRYQNEIREKKIVTYTAVLAILIACLGLFGLSSYLTEQRTKEIGVRKVLGAKTTGIAILLYKDFIKLVLFSIVIAIPLAYYFTRLWLDNFFYRIDIQWWVFTMVGLASIIIAFVAVFYHTMKASLADPVKSLKSD